MKATIANGKLTIVMDIAETVSKSGKSVVIASTRGNVQTALQHNGQSVTIGVNAYIPKA